MTFAGPVGSSKSQISNYLSTLFNLPILENDVIRNEVKTDLGYFNEEVYTQRRDERLKDIFNKKISFIYDASIDRYWGTYLSRVKESGYKFFIISLDVSQSFLDKLQLLGGDRKIADLKRTFKDHALFVKAYGNLINMSIDDENFKDRLEICRQELEKWLIELKLRK